MAESHQDEIAKLEALYQSNPRGRVFTHLAEAYRKAGRLERAREIVQDGLRYHQDYASAHVVLGRVYADLGRVDDAAPEFRRVLELDPENRIALRGLGEYEQRRGNAGEALDYFRQLARFDPGDEELAGTIEQLERSAAALPPPPEPAAPAPDVFGDYPDAHGGGYGDGGYGYTPPPSQPAAEPVPDETPATGFEPLPLSMDWPDAGATGTGSLDQLNWGDDAAVADAGRDSDAESEAEAPGAAEAAADSAPGLRLEWDLAGRADVHGPVAPMTEHGAGEPGEGPAASFHFDATLGTEADAAGSGEAQPAASPGDPSQAWKELENAASAALPPADYDALPPASPELSEEEKVAANEAAAAFAAWDTGSDAGHEAAETSPEPEPGAEAPSDRAAADDAARSEESIPDAPMAAVDDPREPEPQAPAAAVHEPPEAEPEPAVAGVDERHEPELEAPAAAVHEPEPEAERDTVAAELGAREEAPDMELLYDPAEGDEGSFDVETRDLPDAAETEVYTETLAELYRAQGFPARAAEVYRGLLADRPGDERLLTKLREVEGAEVIDPAPASEAAAESWSELADSLERGDLAETEAALESERPQPEWGEPDEPEAIYLSESEWQEAEDAAEPEWLESVESAWTGGAGAAPVADSMFSPPAEEGGDEGAGGQPLGTVLQALLDWRPTRQPDGDPEEEILLLDDVVAEPGAAGLPGWDEEDGYAQGAAAVDGSVTGPGETSGSTADGWSAPWDGEEVASTEADVAGDAQPWASEAAGSPPEPWDAAERAGAGEEEWMPWEETASPAADAPSTDEDEVMPWQGATTGGLRPPEGADAWEPTTDPLAQASKPGGIGNPFEAEPRQTGPAPQPPAPDRHGADDDDDDDDLEMFRSWLQSLKR